jgi:hypothetical protein
MVAGLLGDSPWPGRPTMAKAPGHAETIAEALLKGTGYTLDMIFRWRDAFHGFFRYQIHQTNPS